MDDYSDILKESAADGTWKTAQHVNPEDFPRLTRRLRYQASNLRLSIEIRTDKQLHTVSFLTHNLDW
jgi:hypothetical protein